MNEPEYKKIFASILIGACVAFLSALFEGLVHFLQGYGNNITGGAIASIAYRIMKV